MTTRMPAFLSAAAMAVLSLTLLSCGGSGGGPGPDGAGQGLVLVSFVQDSLDNVALNSRLEFRFSEPVNPATISSGSIQLREGASFGLAVAGTYSVSGSTVYFEPRLPSRCDLSDSGFKADTVYSIQMVGAPEFFAIESAVGDPLPSTLSFEFSTRAENDPNRFVDAVPGVGPTILSSNPTEGLAAAPVGSQQSPQRIEFQMSENLDPCTITPATVRVQVYERGGTIGQSVQAPNGLLSGFVTGGTDVTDQSPDPTTWGSDTGTPWAAQPQSLPISLHLVQDFTSTRLVVSPLNGQSGTDPAAGGILPENVLIVVTLSNGITDFAGVPLPTTTLSFTTENLPPTAGTYVMENAGETAYDQGGTTADVNSARSPSLVQGFMLFSGDGDNGADPTLPSLPATPGSGCTTDRQVNDNSPDDFDPLTNILLDTGVVNTCTNSTDSSTAVVWEFSSFRIRSGITVRLIGANPAIILVQGDVTIESGGRLLARGDGSTGVPQGRGRNGQSTYTGGTAGGTAVAGGGDGGSCLEGNGTTIPARFSGSGDQGYFMTGTNVDTSVGTDTGPGVGHGNTSVLWQAQTNPCNRNSLAGGGGGHAANGVDGESQGTGAAPVSLDLAIDGVGGGTYGATNNRMPTPEAGSGGGAGGEVRPFTGNVGRGTGGGGGAGGGFIDLTASGNIQVFGTIDAAGSQGGNGSTQPFNPNYTVQPGTGGGGGGSGGGIRLLTPADIVVGTTTVISAAGGQGGVGGQAQGNQPPVNNGGAGGAGRVVFEDGDSVITGFAGASVFPSEGQDGFYRGVFDPTRFSGGGLTPQALTEVFPAGPFNPTYLEPVQADFIAGAPSAASPGTGQVVILIEAQSFDVQADGTAEAVGNGWRTIGHFTDSGIESLPMWNAGHPGALPRAPDNIGNPGIDNMASMNGDEFVQFRFTMFLSSSVSPTDPGAFLDRWTLRFTSDN